MCNLGRMSRNGISISGRYLLYATTRTDGPVLRISGHTPGVIFSNTMGWSRPEAASFSSPFLPNNRKIDIRKSLIVDVYFNQWNVIDKTPLRVFPGENNESI